MRALGSCFCSVQAVEACQDLPVLSAWLQRMLSSSSVHTSSRNSSEVRRGPAPRAQQTGNKEQKEETSSPQPPASDTWKSTVRYGFSIRPSVLSPLHALHKEGEEIEQRVALLRTTLEAHVKLSTEIHPDELAKYSAKPDPVTAALKARRKQLSAVKSSYDKLLKDHIKPCTEPWHMQGYYTLLEMSLKHKDEDAAEFQKVLEGDRTIWDYWFKHFTPQYAGLPSLGSIEKIYNQVDDEKLIRDLAKSQVPGAKPPPEPKVDRWGRARATGSRKTSDAQVFVWRGTGRILVNRKPLDAYFPDLLMRSAALKPLSVTGLMGQIDVLVQVDGGGVSGQAQAAAHGIAKALKRLDPSLKPALKSAGLLKRDPRMVERKKPGRAKARKAFAWVKR